MDILTTTSQPDYELIDSGNGQKYERYGTFTLVRPDPQALWLPKKSKEEWSRADATFNHTTGSKTGTWHLSPKVPPEWSIKIGDLSFVIKPSSFKHTGLFPEHISQWKWLREEIRAAQKAAPNRHIKVLNLFAYTGGATLSCAKEGVEVCHVDASKVAITWAKKNAELSGLKDAPIRWIVDDALAFVKREVKRGEKYDIVMMDPPSFGRGAKGEVWKIEDQGIELLQAVGQILSPNPLFVVFNGYAAGYSPISYQNALTSVFPKIPVEAGEMAIADSYSRLLPAGIYARALFNKTPEKPVR